MNEKKCSNGSAIKKREFAINYTKWCGMTISMYKHPYRVLGQMNEADVLEQDEDEFRYFYASTQGQMMDAADILRGSGWEPRAYERFVKSEWEGMPV